MNCIYKVLFLSLLLIANAANASEPESPLVVNLPALSLNLTYPSPVRLSEVLSDTEKTIQNEEHPPVFWLAAQLLEKNKNSQIMQLKSDLIAQLIHLGQIDPRTKSKADHLITFIENNEFNYRHFINLDNDLIRIQDQLHPLLSGSLTLLTPPRANQIRLIGGQVKNQQLTHHAHFTVDDYLQLISLPKESDISSVYIIQPDGFVDKVNNAYWNKTASFFAPGATLFIGFKHLPSQFSSLNEHIADLLRYLSPLTVVGTIQ